MIFRNEIELRVFTFFAGVHCCRKIFVKLNFRLNEKKLIVYSVLLLVNGSGGKSRRE